MPAEFPRPARLAPCRAAPHPGGATKPLSAPNLRSGPAPFAQSVRGSRGQEGSRGTLRARSSLSWFSGLQGSHCGALGAGRPDSEYRLTSVCPQPRNRPLWGTPLSSEAGGTDQLTLGTVGRAPERSRGLLGGAHLGAVARKEYSLRVPPGDADSEGAAWGCMLQGVQPEGVDSGGTAWGCSLAGSKGGLCGQSLELPHPHSMLRGPPSGWGAHLPLEWPQGPRLCRPLWDTSRGYTCCIAELVILSHWTLQRTLEGVGGGEGETEAQRTKGCWQGRWGGLDPAD